MICLHLALPSKQNIFLAFRDLEQTTSIPTTTSLSNNNMPRHLTRKEQKAVVEKGRDKKETKEMESKGDDEEMEVENETQKAEAPANSEFVGYN